MRIVFSIIIVSINVVMFCSLLPEAKYHNTSKWYVFFPFAMVTAVFLFATWLY